MTQRKRWMRAGMVLAVLLAVVLMIWNVLTPHKRIAMSDVVKVELEPKGSKDLLELNQAEAKQVIEWFNKAEDVVNNSHHGAPGCGMHSVLLFHLDSGDVITVFSYMRVTRGKPNSQLEELSADYYFKQPDLEQYLRSWDAKADAKEG